MSDSKLSPAPLSPHLQVYRLPLTAWLSVLHRATGVFLASLICLSALILYSLSQGETSYHAMRVILNSPLGQLFLFGLSFAFIYHLCNGVRHLFWDLGYGFEQQQIRYSAYAVVILSLSITLLFWLFILFF